MTRPGDPSPVPDPAPARWLADRIQGCAVNVGSVVPHGFGAYARILHPATRIEPDGATVEVRWSEVAGASGRTVDPEMQFASIGGATCARHDAEPVLPLFSAYPLPEQPIVEPEHHRRPR